MKENKDLIKTIAEHREKYGILGEAIFSQGYAMGYSAAMDEAHETMNKLKEALETLRINIENGGIKKETDNSL